MFFSLFPECLLFLSEVTICSYHRSSLGNINIYCVPLSYLDKVILKYSERVIILVSLMLAFQVMVVSVSVCYISTNPNIEKTSILLKISKKP